MTKRISACAALIALALLLAGPASAQAPSPPLPPDLEPVSYTHLTLPTTPYV